ncbi:uncharacterized protein LOC110453747 isoform X2 [Mizuhopecten yessoensis]|uniref:uncharacterized protein LOC110453747 isoform X2 n=1 Tax=Mizuhopecten yessoensis TaxID=6573 RepID=UPI000B45ABA0|nr:uncharacterized protein LOC110453747 isoform X2 [Mizuhopecten yessoensis]
MGNWFSRQGEQQQLIGPNHQFGKAVELPGRLYKFTGYVLKFIACICIYACCRWFKESLLKCCRRPICKAVKTECFASIGSSVTLRCEVEYAENAVWQCPKSKVKGTIIGKRCSLKIECVDEESKGEYICKVGWCTSETITLRILRPEEIQAFENDIVQFELPTPTQGKEYKWTYLSEISPEVDITNEISDEIDNSKLTITHCGKKVEGTYICKDKETDEQLAAYHLKTKYKVKVDFRFFSKPEDEEFRKNLISGTQQLLQGKSTYEVAIKTPEKNIEDSHPSPDMNCVAYFIKERNSREYEEMRRIYYTDPETVFLLFITCDRRLPDLAFNCKHIAIRFKEYANNVRCDFYDGDQEVAWDNLLRECPGIKK